MTKETGYITNGNIWNHPYAAHAICPDGKIRKIRLNQQANTWFSWPGRCSKYGRGFVTVKDEMLVFTPYTKETAKETEA